MELDTSVLLIDADASRRPCWKGSVCRRRAACSTCSLIQHCRSTNAWLPPTSNVCQFCPPEHSKRRHELLASDTMTRLVEQLSADDPRRIMLFDSRRCWRPPSRVCWQRTWTGILIVAADDTHRGSVTEALATIETVRSSSRCSTRCRLQQRQLLWLVRRVRRVGSTADTAMRLTSPAAHRRNACSRTPKTIATVLLATIAPADRRRRNTAGFFDQYRWRHAAGSRGPRTTRWWRH